MYSKYQTICGRLFQRDEDLRRTAAELPTLDFCLMKSSAKTDFEMTSIQHNL